jgi:hypothetical protein
MKHSILRSLLKLKSAYSTMISLVHTDAIPHRYRVISVSLDENESYIATVQLVGKGQIFIVKPEEILSDDEMTCSFSQKDIRMLTYLGYLTVNSPKYKILAQRLSEQDNKVLFAVLKRGEKVPTIKTAVEISSNSEIIESLDQKDAHMIGYTVGTELMQREEMQKNEIRKSLNSKIKSE